MALQAMAASNLWPVIGKLAYCLGLLVFVRLVIAHFLASAQARKAYCKTSEYKRLRRLRIYIVPWSSVTLILGVMLLLAPYSLLASAAWSITGSGAGLTYFYRVTRKALTALSVQEKKKEKTRFA